MLRVLSHYRALRTENTVEVRILYQELSRRGRQRCMLSTRARRLPRGEQLHATSRSGQCAHLCRPLKSGEQAP
jgi:hypothetical protein